LPAQNYALEQMGRRTGAFEVVVSNDVDMFRPGRIDQFDAICFCNSLGVLVDDPELKKSLVDFVAGGKGLVGIHDGLATFVQWPQYDQWPEFGQMLGGTENGGHPWDGDMAIKVDDPGSPLTAMFESTAFTVRDQAFQLQEPSLRDRLRVLLSIDAARMPPPRRPFFPTRSEDRDFPMSGQIVRDDLPHDVFVNAEVIVDDLVAHADDVGPWDFRVLVREFSGHLAPSFTDDLNEMSQREAKILVRVVFTARKTLGLADRLLRHVEHVPHIDEVTRRHTVAQRCSGSDRECGD
jgi:hypothetical protein